MIDLTPLFIQYKIGWVNGNHYILLFPKDYNDELNIKYKCGDEYVVVTKLLKKIKEKIWKSIILNNVKNYLKNY